MPTNIRPLHFVFKIGNRKKTLDFYRNVLHMKVLRHEEFEQGCDAACNGPYDGKWSKTMIGYGDEDTNFVIELTYNYGVRKYEMGNDFNYLRISSERTFTSLKAYGGQSKLLNDNTYELFDPNGYRFRVQNEPGPSRLTGLSLHSSDLSRSKAYWVDTLKGKLVESEPDLVVNFDNLDYFKLVLVKSNEQKIDHAKAYGRVAFSCPTGDLKPLQSEIEGKQLTVLTPYIELPTPGKATVSVVILADPDGHEICFVGDHEFRDLSRYDPNGERLLDEAILADKSDEWHEKKELKNKPK